MRRYLIAIIGLAAVAGAAFWLLTEPSLLPPPDVPEKAPDLANGEYMFFAGGCASCHAAPGAKGEAKLRLTGGLEMKTHFGTFNVPNISPDREAGIGGWTNADFVAAMTRGVSPDGRHYYPAFPYTSYQRMTAADLIDLKGFIDSLPPVATAVADHDLRFPFSIRRGLGLWKLVYLDGMEFTPDPALNAEQNRGAYLATGPGHCIECHSPRDPFGGLDRGRAFAGGPAAEGDGWVPNLTPDPTGLADWSAREIASSLKDGFLPDFDSFGGAMVAVQENTARLTDADRAAIAAFLKSLRPIANAPAPKPAASDGG